MLAAPRARQQYSYYFADLYTSSEFVGLVDTDTLFINTVTPSSLLTSTANHMSVALSSW